MEELFFRRRRNGAGLFAGRPRPGRHGAAPAPLCAPGRAAPHRQAPPHGLPRCARGLQLAAAEAFNTNTPEWHHEANITTYRRRRDIAEQIMTTLGCSFDHSQVGMFLWGRIPDHYANAEELTEKVLHEARVFITPGFIFGSNGQRYIRISLCAKDEKIKEALERIKKMIN